MAISLNLGVEKPKLRVMKSRFCDACVRLFFGDDLLCKLAQEAHIAFEEEANIGDTVQEHGDAFDADAEGPAAPDFGINVTGFEDIGVDHAGTEDFDPTAAFAQPTSFLPTKDARNIDFDARLCEREETRPQTDFGIFAEERLCEEL